MTSIELRHKRSARHGIGTVAQEELEPENAEARRYPLGAKEFWRNRLVGKASYGQDVHLMTDAELKQIGRKAK